MSQRTLTSSKTKKLDQKILPNTRSLYYSLENGILKSHMDAEWWLSYSFSIEYLTTVNEYIA